MPLPKTLDKLDSQGEWYLYLRGAMLKGSVRVQCETPGQVTNKLQRVHKIIQVARTNPTGKWVEICAALEDFNQFRTERDGLALVIHYEENPMKDVLMELQHEVHQDDMMKAGFATPEPVMPSDLPTAEDALTAFGFPTTPTE